MHYWATVMVALLDVTPPEVAVTLAVPTAVAVASPVEVMLATVLGVAVQVDTLVTSPVEPSLYVAVAVNWTVVGPSDKLRVWVSGAMLTLVTCLVVTVTLVEAITFPLWAFTIAVPKATPVSRPVLLMVAVLGWLVLQVTDELTSAVVLLPYVAVAEYCWVTPGATVAFDGATESAVIEFDDGKNCPQPVMAARKVRTNATRRMKRKRCTETILPFTRAVGEVPMMLRVTSQRAANLCEGVSLGLILALSPEIRPRVFVLD
jgi:hypothetical protein